ncbi:MAG: glycosyltransferase family 4 protein [Chlamydiae bacterium]|nr:glycosyltransferase family 4 protein [Chlamydiota bacterium]
MKTVLVHDWLYSLSGAEKVLEVMYKLFPSKVYTLIYNKKKRHQFSIAEEDIATSFIQRLPLSASLYPYYLPLFPFAIEAFDLSKADVVLSSSSCVAKGVLTHSRQLHICYCHTPMRAAWDLYFDCLKSHNIGKGLKGIMTRLFLHKIRNWDLLHASRVDYFVANSCYVAKRIEKTYRKKATVIYPPVDCEYFYADSFSDEGFYITAGRLVPYKKVDLIVKAFSELTSKRLLILGEGPELARLKTLASKNIEFLGYVSDEELKDYFRRAKAFIYMACEDFGLLPVEAQAAGLAVIAYGQGGVVETVISHKTGILFPHQTVASLKEAIKTFESVESSFDRRGIQDHAKQFSKERFEQAFKIFVQEKYEAFVGEDPYFSRG